MNIRKGKGSKETPVMECSNPIRNIWKVRFGFEEDESGVSFNEATFNHKPTLAEIQQVVIDSINANTDNKILNGLTWKGLPVYLSTENQFNYKAEYDLAVQTSGKSLPVTVKLGTDEKPVYKTFGTLDEFESFYTEVLAYIKKCYTDGWHEKDSIDWTLYQ